MNEPDPLPRRRTPVTWTLILGWMALHALALGQSGWPLLVKPWYEFGRPSLLVLQRLGALDPVLVDLGDVQRVLTYAFLHGFVAHLLLNAWVFSVFGGLLETVAGSLRTWIVFVVAAVAGGWLQLEYGAGFGVGASAGVFGVAGALGVWAFRARHPLAGAAGRTVVIFLILSGLLLLVPRVAHHAHYGGLVAGALVMVLLGPRRCARPPGRGVRIVAGALLLLALAAGARQALAQSGPSREEAQAFVRELTSTEGLARRLYEWPSAATPEKRQELGRRLDDLLATPWLKGWSGEAAFRAYVAAWQPVVTGNVPDPFSFDAQMAPIQAAWLPHRKRLMRESGLSPWP